MISLTCAILGAGVLSGGLGGITGSLVVEPCETTRRDAVVFVSMVFVGACLIALGLWLPPGT